MGEIMAERTCKHSAEMVLRTRVEKRMDAKEENEEKKKTTDVWWNEANNWLFK